ncbi:MAG: TIGR02584 family CRISPR-associated protein, partial [Candidatus Dadabacteria bacterium]
MGAISARGGQEKVQGAAVALKPPSAFGRRILVCVSGLTPQVVTETLYALATASKPFVPTEVHLITTSEGAERARLTLLGKDPGWFGRLLDELELKEVAFGEEQIHVISRGPGEPLPDIRTLDDNEAAADLITEVIRDLTRDERSAVHVSIAGGRKTMGFYAAYALSLYGREQDRLSHVLVSPEFEGHPEFFFPTKSSRVIYALDPSRRPLDTRQARVSLAEIPFVRLRHGLPTALLQGRATFSETVTAAQQAFAPPRLEIDVAEGLVRCGGREVRLRPVEFAFLLWLARRRVLGAGGVSRVGTEPSEFLSCYAEVAGAAGGRYERVEAAAVEKESGELLPEYFDERKARLNRALREVLGPFAEPYLVVGQGKRPDTRYGLLRLDPGAIHIRSTRSGSRAAAGKAPCFRAGKCQG